MIWSKLIKGLLAITFSLILFGCKNNKPTENINDQVTIFQSFDDLSPRFFNASDTTYLVNFWATTCPPCLKEMPHLREVESKYQEEKFKVILVSLDMQRDFDSRVIPYIAKHRIIPEVVLLGDQNYSAWTDKIDSTWYGALPATLIVKGDQKNFSFGAFESVEDIDVILKEFL